MAGTLSTVRGNCDTPETPGFDAGSSSNSTISTPLFPNCDTPKVPDFDTLAPTLISLSLEMLVEILKYVLPDKDVLRLQKGSCGRYTRGSVEWDKIYAKDEPTVEVNRQRNRCWRWDDEFRSKEPVQMAILQANHYLYEIGSQLLYGRTLKVNIWALRGYGLFEQRSLYVELRDFPWTKMRKILVVVHSSICVWKQLLMTCRFLASTDSFIKKPHVVYTDDWDMGKKKPPGPNARPRPDPWQLSEVEIVSMMLEPLQQHKHV